MEKLLIFVTLIILFSFDLSAQQQDSDLQRVSGLFKAIDQTNAYVDNVSDSEDITLPIGLKRTIGGTEVTVAIYQLSMFPDHNNLGVYARMVIPQGENGNRKILFFGAEGINSSFIGGLRSDVRLSLLHDVTFNVNGGNTQITLKGGEINKGGNVEDGCYVLVGCEGFKSLTIDAELKFPTSMIIRPSKSGQAESPVVGKIRTTVSDWDDLIAYADIPDFEIVGVKDYVFSLRDVVFDFSSKRNFPQTSFTAQYSSNYLTGNQELWRGIFAENIQVRLPQAFNGATISGNNLLIDENGITGDISAENVLPLEKGDASGWKFSVNRFGISLLANQLKGCGFSGMLALPFEGGKSQLSYDAIYSTDGNYLMKVKTDSTIDFSLFKARAKLEPNSNITLQLVDNKFVPEAVLHGEMDMGVDSLKLKKVLFRNLRLSTKQPYLTCDYLGYEDELKLGNFPLSVKNIQLSGKNDIARLEFDADVNLCAKEFSGNTRIGIIARNVNNNWTFDRVEIGEIALDTKFKGMFSLQGRLRWNRDDPVFGNGFAGSMNLGIQLEKAQKGINVGAIGGFGRVGDLRYWYVDGMANINPGIPVMAVLDLTGFGGALTYGVVGKPSPGANTFSGVDYYPDKEMGLVLKSAVSFSVKKLVDGNARFEMGFNKSGGLTYAGMFGYAEYSGTAKLSGAVDAINGLKSKYLEYESKLASVPGAKRILATGNFMDIANKAGTEVENMPFGINGNIGIQFDFQNKSFHADTKFYVRTEKNLIRGLGEGGEAGWGVIHADKNEWYIHLGTPENRVGLALNIADVVRANSGSYFMAGTRVPGIPEPPKAVTDILGRDFGVIGGERNPMLLKDGKGMVFGSNFNFSTGDMQFLGFYSSFDTGLGLDIMFKDLANPNIGMNGWYAKGQTYAYMNGAAGVKVKLLGKQRRVEAFRGSTASLLEIGLPNPSYLRGYANLKLRTLGIINTNIAFKINLGQRPESAETQDEKIIASISPVDSEQEVGVFSKPKLQFNIPVDREFTVDESGKSIKLRARLERFDVTNISDGNKLEGEVELLDDNRTAILNIPQSLPSKSKLKADVEIAVEELRNGIWTRTKETESASVSFETAEAPSEIPLSNIRYSYPVIGQKYLLTKESDKGFIQLKSGQDYLFAGNFEYKIKFEDEVTSVYSDLSYNSAEQRIEFSLPELKPSNSYTLKLVFIPKGETGSTSEAQMLAYEFATSAFANFNDKISSLRTINPIVYDRGNVYSLGAEVSSKEPFDEIELQGSETTDYKPLISAVSALEEEYFTQEILPLVYDGYPFDGVRLTNREEKPIGVPPYQSVILDSDYIGAMRNSSINLSGFTFPYTFDASVIATKDFLDLRSQIAGSDKIGKYSRFLLKSPTVIRKGKYKVNLLYTLPDGTVTSQKAFVFNNKLNLND